MVSRRSQRDLLDQRVGLRVIAPAAVALLAVVGALLGAHSPASSAAAVALVVGAAVLAAWRWTSGWPLAAALAVAAAGFWFLGHTHAGNLGWFGYSAIAGWAGTRAVPRQTAALTGAMLLVLAVEFVMDPSEAGWFAWGAGAVFAGTACTLARRQGELLEQLREAQAGLADRTRAEERTRIAAEMHDVIGHALTVSLLHVGTARLAIEEGATDEALAALDLAEDQSRRSLAEVRASVGALRAQPGARLPLPGAADLGELVESFRRAGTPVTCEVEGDLARLSPTAGLAAYRIVQEALTNVARHAPGHAARVRVEVDADTRLRVVSDGRPGPGAGGTGGTGLIGMRERAESVGGSLSAGPAEHGWLVEAVLP